MNEIVEGKVKKWGGITSTSNGKFKSSLKLENDDRFFGIFSPKYEQIKDLFETVPVGAIIKFENLKNQDYNNIVPKSIKLVKESDNILPSNNTEPDWDAKEKRKIKQECLTKVTGFFQICKDQNILTDGEILSETKYNNLYLLWLKTVDDTVDYIYSKNKVNEVKNAK